MKTTAIHSLLPVLAAVAGGLAVGAFFGLAWLGLSIALAGCLAFHLYRLISLDRVLAERNSVKVPEGDGVWSRVLAAVRHEQQRVKKYKNRHRALMKELRHTTNALPDGIIALGQDNEIIRYNPAASQLLGLRKRRDRGQRIDHLIRHPEFVAMLQAEDSRPESIVIPSSQMDDGWLSMTLVPYGRGNRLLTVRDVTERTRLARVRRDFVANASHELRTPLTVISGYIEALSEDGSLDDLWDKPLDEMTRQADRMRTMLDELLALSRLEVRREASMEKRVDIGMVLREAAALYIDEPRPIEVEVHSSHVVLGEYSDISSVALNLLTNAIRYSEPSSPIRLIWRDVDDGRAELVVIDRGEGIAPDDLPRLTERFFRVNRGRERASGGVGLGLAIVKHALARHDATLEIESEIDVGSTFRCVFPSERLVKRESAEVHEMRRA
ncbi:MAG: phosphate regulon sensor histidine kinase PhoR [Pseudomonadota bacterium]